MPSVSNVQSSLICKRSNATQEARNLIERAQRGRDIINLIGTIIVYKFGSLSRDEVNQMLGIELQETRVYQEAKAESEAGLVLRLLNRRVGSVPSQLF